MKGWEYRGRWALVTGASSGIGEAFAHVLAARGMHLVLTARREERLRELANTLGAANGIQTAVLPADLGEPGAAVRLWEQAASDRAIHLLVNNAGFGLHGRFNDLSLERQTGMVQLNCVAPMELAHLALPGMRKRGEGGIINVASTASFQPVPLMATYAATKAFVLSLSAALRDENRDAGVRVLALCPGGTPTEFQQAAGTRLQKHSPGVLQPEQVVHTALRALDAGKTYVVPGAANYAGSVLARVFPLPLVTRAARVVMERMR